MDGNFQISLWTMMDYCNDELNFDKPKFEISVEDGISTFAKSYILLKLKEKRNIGKISFNLEEFNILIKEVKEGFVEIFQKDMKVCQTPKNIKHSVTKKIKKFKQIMLKFYKNKG